MSATVSDGPYRVTEMRDWDIRTRASRWAVTDTRTSAMVVERVTFGDAAGRCSDLNEQYQAWQAMTQQAQTVVDQTAPNV